MKVYTHEEYMAKLKLQAATGPTVKIGRKKFKAAIEGMITAVKCEAVNDKPAVVLYLRQDNGEEYGVVMTRIMAKDLTKSLGPHPLVEKFFNLN